jgi:exodeoxyribonuclease III
MKIATYNVNSVNARMHIVSRWLEETKPDVICLQELKAPDDKFPGQAFADLGYKGIWHGQKSWNGVAILARNLEVRELRRGLPGDPDDTHSRYIEALVGGVVIGCLYLPNGNPAPGSKFDYKLAWFERFTQHAEGLLKQYSPVVLVGDYNVIPDFIDAYKAERWVNDALFRTETRDAFKNLLSQGWTDAIRKLYPTETIYTFWDFFRDAYGRNAGLRIDHFLLSPQLDERLVAGGVDRNVRGWEKSSDHGPVWIELAD